MSSQALATSKHIFLSTDLQHDVPCMAWCINLIKIQFVRWTNHLFGIAYNKRVRDCSSEAIYNHTQHT
ncbi:hypothetical protein KCU83_g369, partial [Aureobasidium melanogenum]